jgi:mRNA interferase YafQ
VSNYKYKPKKSAKFKRNLRAAQKQGLDINQLEWCIDQLAQDISLPPNWKDHQLKGHLRRYRECHIGGAGDWLLVYEKQDNEMILYLLGTGSHTDLLGL